MLKMAHLMLKSLKDNQQIKTNNNIVYELGEIKELLRVVSKIVCEIKVRV